MTEKSTEQETKMSSNKWSYIVMIVCIIIFVGIPMGGLALHDIAKNQCKVAAINKGMTAPEVAVACK